MAKNNYKRKYTSFHEHIDPLVLRGEAKHSEHSDIFLFGIILRNIATIIEDLNGVTLVRQIATECTSLERPALTDIANRFANF